MGKKRYQLLENLLECSRMQTGTISFNPEPVELITVVDDAIEVETIGLKNKQIEIETHIETGLIVYSDYNMVYIVMRNLISNACNFTHLNGKITIGASIDWNNSNVEVVVSDTGVGISAKNQENIFRIGHNVRSAGTGNEMGSGLGLILCKEFVEKQRADLERKRRKYWHQSIY